MGVSTPDPVAIEATSPSNFGSGAVPGTGSGFAELVAADATSFEGDGRGRACVGDGKVASLK